MTGVIIAICFCISAAVSSLPAVTSFFANVFAEAGGFGDAGGNISLLCHHCKPAVMTGINNNHQPCDCHSLGLTPKFVPKNDKSNVERRIAGTYTTALRSV